jgi:hypothetical protein
LSSFVKAHHPSVNRMVAGSNPARGAKHFNYLAAAAPQSQPRQQLSERAKAKRKTAGLKR